jgi:hypothetical protein
MTSTKPQGWDGTPPGLADTSDDDPTTTQLRARAKELNISGRSKMSRDELEAAIIDAEGPGDPA